MIHPLHSDRKYVELLERQKEKEKKKVQRGKENPEGFVYENTRGAKMKGVCSHQPIGCYHNNTKDCQCRHFLLRWGLCMFRAGKRNQVALTETYFEVKNVENSSLDIFSQSFACMWNKSKCQSRLCACKILEFGFFKDDLWMENCKTDILRAVLCWYS